MPNEILKYLDCHIDTERAKNAKWVSIKNIGMKVEDAMISIQEYQLSLPYVKVNSCPTLIQLGYKNHRICVRVISNDQKTQNDFYGDNLEQLKKLTQEIINCAILYQRTIWFIRAKLIPAIFSIIRSLLVSHQFTLKS